MRKNANAIVITKKVLFKVVSNIDESKKNRKPTQALKSVRKNNDWGFPVIHFSTFYGNKVD